MASILDDARLDWALLEEFNFDRNRFEKDRMRIESGELSPASAIVREEIEPVDDVIEVKWEQGSDEMNAGDHALRRGEVCVMVLNGGMATRFGGVVKGVVEVYDGKSFLDLKAEDVLAALGTFNVSIPLVLMNSFATEAETDAHITKHKNLGLAQDQLIQFHQSISIRMNEDGSLFIGNDGKPSYHSPGHGDWFTSIRHSQTLQKLLDRGIKYLLFSNVDNLGATVDPTLLGHHIVGGFEMTCELTEKRRTASGNWDKGGAPAKLGGREQLVEGFRFPPDFAQETLPDFSTNNMIFSLAAIDRGIDLARHVVKKTVDGRTALQLESITCEASAVDNADGTPALKLGLLRVPRDGARGRFFPVKEPIDLEKMRKTIKQRLEDGWTLRDQRT